ncbi:chlorophyll A-B binding protein [Aphanothece hegewaldii CCALA 016]|uniref:Chlorophyll A-B binding protein n=1 Tax=Aphanothece hegewaldii CCALA 016 TaxID=2107694 RepID=A0A2T1LV04_9CHRO|nr:chlorophyll a/b-binding protein [Aphanothece hegewaldii]PSF35453.1 chlorophyll A-B binding protein [Aphanothece hegewaldii CCALA 016]
MESKQPTDYYEQQAQRKYGEFATKFQFGSNPSAEIWNGRLAMVGFLLAILIEVFTGQGVLSWLGLY